MVGGDKESYFGWESYLGRSQLLLRHEQGDDYQLYELADAWPATLRKPFTPPRNNMLLDSIFISNGKWYGIGESSYFEYEVPKGSVRTQRLYGRFRLYFPGELTAADRRQLEAAYVQQQSAADPALGAALRRRVTPPRSNPGKGVPLSPHQRLAPAER